MQPNLLWDLGFWFWSCKGGLFAPLLLEMQIFTLPKAPKSKINKKSLSPGIDEQLSTATGSRKGTVSDFFRN
ncbi:MAG: hypothetical protein AB1861_18445 [Cyanobacteriota bacterium]